VTQPSEAGILFSDIAGSSRLYEAIGNAAALPLVEKYYSMQMKVVAKHGGTVVKTIGDEIMAAFPDVITMFDASVEMQIGAEQLAMSPAPAAIQLHIGLYFGPVVKMSSDYFGETVNTAAHLSRIAKAQQIVTGMEIADQLDGPRRLAVRDLAYFPIKGRHGGLHAVEIMWGQTRDRTVFSPGRVIAPRGAHSLLKLQHCGTEWVCDGQKIISIGRDATNDILIPTNATSRKHALIELRGDKWVLVDRSTNGTFVSMGLTQGLHLHCEEIILHESGIMELGQQATPLELGRIRFTLSPI
jgi:class 3 adenylate cyclase